MMPLPQVSAVLIKFGTIQNKNWMASQIERNEISRWSMHSRNRVLPPLTCDPLVSVKFIETCSSFVAHTERQ